MKFSFITKIHFIVFFFLTSCSFLPAVGENYKKPQTKMPKKWDSLGKVSTDEEKLEDIEQAWWKNFSDPILNQTIAIAIANNYDLKIAKSRILEARSNVKVKQSDLGPKVTASTSATRRDNYINPINPNNHRIFNLFTAGFDATWEIDLFGGNRRAKEAAKASFEAVTEEKNDILISLIAEVAKNYADLRDAQNQILWQKEIAKFYQEIAEISSEKKQAGLLNDIDFGHIKIEMLENHKNLADAKARVEIALYNLESLLGKNPGEMKESFSDVKEVPLLKTDVIVNAPVALLNNRPDIRQAERNLASATALKSYAIAQVFPKISLSNFFGFYNTKSGNLLKSQSKVFSSGATITAPILDFGGLLASKKMAEERQKQALLQYKSQVNKALLDVESSIINFVKSDEKLFLTLQSNETYEMIDGLNEERYEKGIISYIDRLRSQIEFLQSQQQLSQSKLDFTFKTIALYKSLGGGWKIRLEKK